MTGAQFGSFVLALIALAVVIAIAVKPAADSAADNPGGWQIAALAAVGVGMSAVVAVFFTKVKTITARNSSSPTRPICIQTSR